MPAGTVTRSTGSHYLVRDDGGVVHECVARGNLRIQGFMSTNPIAVGDHVEFTPGDGEQVGSVLEVKDRRNYLVRRSVNLSHQKSVIAANMDQALLMVTLARPRTSTGFIDRFLVSAEAYEIPCIILFNKLDAYAAAELASLQELERVYGSVGYRTIRTSAHTGTGVDDVRTLLAGKVSLLAGHSGVGKSTLINTIQPGFDLPTSVVSESTTKGQHTTTHASMFDLALGGSIIDTPGIKGFGLVDMDAATISDQFPEFFKLKGACKFASCLHLQEPGCAVRAAVQEGAVAGSRYASYQDMVSGVEEDGPYRRD